MAIIVGILLSPQPQLILPSMQQRASDIVQTRTLLISSNDAALLVKNGMDYMQDCSVMSVLALPSHMLNKCGSRAVGHKMVGHASASTQPSQGCNKGTLIWFRPDHSSAARCKQEGACCGDWHGLQPRQCHEGVGPFLSYAHISGSTIDDPKKDALSLAVLSRKLYVEL